MPRLYRLPSKTVKVMFFGLLGVSVLLPLLPFKYFSLLTHWQYFRNINVSGNFLRGLHTRQVSGPGQPKPVTSGEKCVLPKLSVSDPAVMQYYQQAVPVTCSSAMKNWVYVSNGTFHISPEAIRLYGTISCDYSPIKRNGDFKTQFGPTLKNISDGAPLTADFFEVFCLSSSGKTYSNIHSAVARNVDVMKRLHDYHSHVKNTAHNTQSDGFPSLQSLSERNLSVFMFGFDSLSHMSWMRLLPKSRRYYLETLGGIELNGYNVIGDGTPAALMPILTGKIEEELPETRRGFKGATVVDSHPWIWKDFSKRGYVTAWAEDMASVGTFECRLMGFREQPTDHFMRPFYISAEAKYDKHSRFCLGSTPRHINFMNWFRDLFEMYKDFPKFFFGFHSELSHDSNNPVQALDDDLVNFLKDLERKGHLNSTLLILMADHGARFSYIRETAQGKLEERLPYFSFRFPPWFHKVYPDIVKNVQTNVNRLTTPFDIHATLHDILNYSPTTKGDITNRAISLFKAVPTERTCSQAHITPHWCVCLPWKEASSSDPMVMLAVNSVLDYINGLLKPHQRLCAQLTLLKITKSFIYVPNSRDRQREWIVLKYNHMSAPSTKRLYQVSFKTSPGEGHFEATCKYDMKSNTLKVDGKQISRINKYGSQPACIQETKPHLRPYCYCI